MKTISATPNYKVHIIYKWKDTYNASTKVLGNGYRYRERFQSRTRQTANVITSIHT